MTDPKKLVKQLRDGLVNVEGSMGPIFSPRETCALMQEAAAFIEAHDKPPLSREEMTAMWKGAVETLYPPNLQIQPAPNAMELCALVFGEAIQRHFMGGG